MATTKKPLIQMNRHELDEAIDAARERMRHAAADPFESMLENEVRWLNVNSIHPSPFNPRKTCDQAKLEELAVSVRAKGVLEPILCRPRPVKTGQSKATAGYEIVAGHRRWEAAKLAGLIVIPAMVRNFSDSEALEIAVVENEQREDLSPLEKAAGYQQLIDRHGMKVEDLAKKIGKSAATIYGLLKLVNLPEKARKAVESGELPAATAQLVARIPSAKLRKEATRRIMSPGYATEGPKTYRQALEIVHRDYMRELKRAPFSQHDPELVASAGACTVCPKQAGNDRAEYPDGRADMCMDPVCYAAKVTAHNEQLLNKALASGKNILRDKKLFSEHNPGKLRGDSNYIDLADTCHEVYPSKGWKPLVGKELADLVVVAVDPEGKLHELVPEAKARAIVRKKQRVKNLDGSARTMSPWEKQRRDDGAIDKEVTRRAMAAVADRAQDIAAAHGDQAMRLEMMRLLVEVLVDATWEDVNRLVVQRRGLRKEKAGHSGGNRDLVAALVPTLDGPGLLGLFAELMAGKRAMNYYEGDARRSKPFWDFFDVDKQSLKKQVKAELARKAKSKPSANGNGKHGPERGKKLAKKVAALHAGDEHSFTEDDE